jgi:RIMS-binding protein 2
MVEEIKDPNQISQLQSGQQHMGGKRNQGSNDRWGDIYGSIPVKKMIALYDYNPQELSPNVDAEVSSLL